jgi:hypothetical protein
VQRPPHPAARSLRRAATLAITQLAVVLAVLGTVVLTSAPASAATRSPSGWAMPVGDLPGDRYAPRGWHQVFADTFNTSNAKRANTAGALGNDKWWGYWAGTRIVNSVNGVYDSSRVVSLSDSMMHFRLHSANGTAYAAVESPKLPSQTYGRYTVRYRYAPGSNIAGFKSVWMLWPDSNQWGDGEVDFHELGNEANRRSGWAAMLQACGYNTGCPQQVQNFPIDVTKWHTATVMWTPGRIRVWLDGHLMATSTTRVPNKPMHLLLQTEASDYGPVAKPNAVMNIDVDWVTVYTRK